jgi:DNA-binding transcriptional LysR family regulator
MIDYSLKVFLTVAKLNSFTRAAEFLNLSQPAVTHQIKNLETMFKARLFDRGQNKIELTQSGQILLRYAENIDSLYQKATQEIHEMTNQVAGDIHLGAASLLGKYLLPRILGNFKKIYPHVNLSMLVGNSKEILGFLESGAIELAIVSEPIPSKNLTAFRFYRDQLTVVAYPNHLWCRKKEITTKDLYDEDFISREMGSGTREFCLKSLRLPWRSEELKPVMVLGSSEAIKMAVIGEMGFSILSRLAIRSEVELGLLKEVRLKGVDMVRNFFVVFKSEKHLSLPALKLKEYLKEMKDLDHFSLRKTSASSTGSFSKSTSR